MLTKCVKTLVFFFIPFFLSLLSRMSIEPLMHSECLACKWFQAFVFWHFYMFTCLCPNIAFNTNILQSRVLESPHLNKCKRSPCHLLFIHCIATNHLYNCQQRQCMRISILIFLLTIIQKSVHLWRDIVNPYFLSDQSIQIGTSSIVQN